MAKMSYNKNVNIGRVVTKLISTILALYVGGFVLNEFGNVMKDTCSSFYKGLSLIGWTLNSTASDGTSITNSCVATTSGAGVLAVVGIIGIASIVLEFVKFKL